MSRMICIGLFLAPLPVYQGSDDGFLIILKEKVLVLLFHHSSLLCKTASCLIFREAEMCRNALKNYICLCARVVQYRFGVSQFHVGNGVDCGKDSLALDFLKRRN